MPVIYDMPADEYHTHPALSSTGARKLIAPSCPALFRHWRDNGQPANGDFDFGHAAHQLVLGSGPDIIEVPYDSWRTNAAKARRAEAYSIGATPLLSDDVATVHAMADALRKHPVAAALLTGGRSEVTLLWTDTATGVDCRARLDHLPEPVKGKRLVIPDYKTTNCAEPEKFAKTAVDHGYHQQQAWYLDGATACELADDLAFVFIAQEKTPPYLVQPVQLDANALRIGRIRNRLALDTYAECVKTGEWPGYEPDIALAPLPRWYEIRYEDI